MQIFLKVADTGQFTRAAQQLNLPPSRVTRYVDDLESRLGVKLLQRSARRSVLTDVGVQYARGCRTLLSSLARVEASATRASTAISGELRVAMVSGLAQQGFAALFAEYRASYPDVSLYVTSTETPIDLVSSRFDVGILSSEMIKSTTHVSRTLIRSRLVPVAAPSYLARMVAPQRPDHLSEHRVVGVAAWGRNKQWHFTGDEEYCVRVREAVVASSRMMQKQLAMVGAGIALLPEWLVEGELRRGELVHLLKAYRVSNDDLNISLVYPSRDFLPGQVRAFVELASEYVTRGRGDTVAAGGAEFDEVDFADYFAEANLARM
jgi:DNA-binding transcriptional LysR family regulator